MRVMDDGPALDAIADVINRLASDHATVIVIAQIVRNTDREIQGQP